MLVGKNVVIVKSTEKGVPPVIKEYDRVYLEFASTDKLAEYSKTTGGKDLEFEGKVWKGLKPADKESKVPASDLVPEALAYFQKNFPGTEIKGTPEEIANVSANRAWLTLLEAAGYGADLWKRNEIQSDIRPGKPMDKTAAIGKMVKMLKALNPKMSDAKALAVATAAVETEDSEEVTA